VWGGGEAGRSVCEKGIRGGKGKRGGVEIEAGKSVGEGG
jgi:hypothetical protein